jgi:hypothetical protein
MAATIQDVLSGLNLSAPRIDPNARLSQATQGGGTFGAAFLKDSIAKGRSFEAQGERLRARDETSIGAVGGRINRVKSGANLAAQRAGSSQIAGPRGFAGSLEQAVRRGKARQGINERGEKAIRNQQLKDRITLARQSLSKRSTLIQSSASAARLRAGGDAAAQSARDQTNSAFAGALGSVAGGALRGFGDKLFDTGDLGDTQSSIDSFFDAGPGSIGGLDNNFDTGFGFGPPTRVA